jgi:hypothetical protein
MLMSILIAHTTFIKRNFVFKKNNVMHYVFKVFWYYCSYVRAYHTPLTLRILFKSWVGEVASNFNDDDDSICIYDHPFRNGCCTFSSHINACMLFKRNWWGQMFSPVLQEHRLLFLEFPFEKHTRINMRRKCTTTISEWMIINAYTIIIVIKIGCYFSYSWLKKNT